MSAPKPGERYEPLGPVDGPPAAILPAERAPGRLRPAAAGAWHVFAGFWLVLRSPRMWPLALLPALLALLGILSGLLAAAYSLRGLETALLPPPGRMSALLTLVLTLTLWLGVLAAGALAGLGVALFLAAPVLERISRVTEQRVRGRSPADAPGTRWEIAQSLRGALYLLVAAPVVFALSLVPVAGPVVAAFWGAHAMALQQTEAPLARRGLSFRARRAWHRRYRAESLGFGLAALLLLLVPVANLLLAPALSAGGTLLVLALEDGGTPAAADTGA